MNRLPTIEEIEYALFIFFKRNISITNYFVSGHEADFLMVRKTKYAVEVEIKRSVADLKADLKKPHGHKSRLIAELYYAVPEKIYDKCLPLIPEDAGVFQICYSPFYGTWLAYKKRGAKRNKDAVKWNDQQIEQILRYSNYHIWSAKKKIIKLKKQRVMNAKERQKAIKKLSKTFGFEVPIDPTVTKFMGRLSIDLTKLNLMFMKRDKAYNPNSYTYDGKPNVSLMDYIEIKYGKDTKELFNRVL